jgi:hypothetical protein
MCDWTSIPIDDDVTTYATADEIEEGQAGVEECHEDNNGGRGTVRCPPLLQ